MFSDESHFQIRFANSRMLSRRPVDLDRFDPQFTHKTVKFPPKIMAWGSFSWFSSSVLEFLKKGEMMNGVR